MTIRWIFLGLLVILLTLGAIADNTVYSLSRGLADTLYCRIDASNCQPTYGFIYISNDSNAETPIAVQNTYYNITESIQLGVIKNMNFSNNAIVITSTGVYDLDYNVAFMQTTGAGAEWLITVGINGVPKLRCDAARKISTITYVGHTGSACILELSAGDIITPMIANKDSTDSAIISDMQLTVNKK